MGRANDRYIVRELHGFPIVPHGAGVTNSQSPGATDVYVMDTYYCHRVVASYPGRSKTGPGGRTADSDLMERRLQAQSQANRWNEEHRRWLHAGRWGVA